MSTYYSSQLVWKWVDKKHAVRYLCLFDLVNKKYAVQNAEFFYLPISQERMLEADINGVELFVDINPLDRCEWFDEVLEAVAAHDLSFS